MNHNRILYHIAAKLYLNAKEANDWLGMFIAFAAMKQYNSHSFQLSA